MASMPLKGGKNFNLCAHKLKFLPVGGEKAAMPPLAEDARHVEGLTETG